MMDDNQPPANSTWTPWRKREASIACFASGSLILIVTPITAIGLLPEIGLIAAIVLVTTSLVMGASSMPTKLGRVVWVLVEVSLAGAIAYLAWRVWISLYVAARFG